MKRFLPLIIVPFLGALALVIMLVKLSHADVGSGSAGSGSVVAVVDAGSGSAASSTPADKLADPVDNPTAAYDDLKAAKRESWPVLAFAIVLMLARVVGKAGKSVPLLAKLATGRVAVVVAGAAAVAAAGYNAAFAGGSAIALITAVVATALAYWNSQAAPTKVAS